MKNDVKIGIDSIGVQLYEFQFQFIYSDLS